MLKRIFSIFAISLIITGLFFEGYSLKCPVYADDTVNGWFNVTTNEQLVEAFKYYCKSRDLTIEGSLADAVTSFTTKAFNGICNTLGIDLTALQGELKYQTDGNTGMQFLFTNTGVDAYNRIFAQFLQDNEIEVGDQVNKVVDSGSAIGNSMLWEVVGRSSAYTKGTVIFNYNNYTNVISREGNSYVYDDLIDYHGDSLNFPTFNVSFPTYYYNGSVSSNISNYQGYTFADPADGGYAAFNYGINGNYVLLGTNVEFTSSCTALAKNVTNNHIVLFLHYQQYPNKNGRGYYGIALQDFAPDDQYVVSNVRNFNVNLTTNNNTVNNNNYEGDTIINNEGDIINNNPDPDPDPPTPDSPTVPDSGGWEDFQLPTMPNDWLIYGMEKKFPFDIPFNIMFGLSLLNHEPEIPKFEGDIDLKVCTWHYDIDLTPFDGIAQILRKFEVLAFIIGLAILTKELIMWG